MHRRDLLNAAVFAGGISLCSTVAAEKEPAESIPIIDTNVSLFQWPFRRLPLDNTATLATKLRSLGISEAWAGSFEGVLHRDVAGVNRRLVDECQRHPELLAVGSVNLELPDWEQDLQRCLNEYRMPAIRLHPNYHGYTLADPRFRQLLERTSSANCLVQVVVAMEDTRTQHPLVQVPDVDLSPLPDLLGENTAARVQLLNYRPNGKLFDRLARTPGVLFDTARVEGTDGVQKQLLRTGPKKVLFGSHAPFLIPEAALIRTCETSLSEDQLRSLLSENAVTHRRSN